MEATCSGGFPPISYLASQPASRSRGTYCPLTDVKGEFTMLLYGLVMCCKEFNMEVTDLSPRTQLKRERIHQAAQALFMQQGFEATSMDTLALAAGVSKPTLYRYYHNKEALFITVLEQLAVGHLSDHRLLALRERPMENLSVLEEALTLW